MRIALRLVTLFAALTLAWAAHAQAQGMCGMGSGMSGRFPPGTDPALLPDADTEGARLLQSYCTQCHGLPAPGLHTAEEWPAVAERMVWRMRHMGHMGMMHGSGGMGMMGGIRAPAAEEFESILAYLTHHAQQAAGEELHEALESPAGKTFRAICSQCHALPSPAQHSAREWAAVVERMKGNATALGKTVPDEAQTRDIVAFLREHARAAD